jgi:hypothetical protein
MFPKVVSLLEKTQTKAVVGGKGFVCPKCGAARHGSPADADAILDCACGYFGSLVEWTASAASGVRVGRAGSPPPGTRITRSDYGRVHAWEIPPSGKSGGLLVFGWIWTIFIALFYIVPLVALLQGAGEGFHSILSLLLFTLPFWAVGIGILYAGYRAKNAKHRVEIGDGVVSLTRDWRGKRKTKSLPLGDVRSIGQVVFYSKNYTPVRGVEIKGATGKLRFGSTLSDEEKAWLVADFQQAVWPDKASAVVAEGSRQTIRVNAFSVALPQTNNLWGLLFVLGMCIAFMVIGLKVILREAMAGPVLFRTVWLVMDGLFFLLCLSGIISALRSLGVETRLDGDTRHLTLRKVKKGLTLKETVFERSEFHDIRASAFGSSNGREMKRIELLIGEKAHRLASWMDGAKADEFVAEVRRAIG